MTEARQVSPGELDGVMEFNHVIEVHPGGYVTEPRGYYTDELGIVDSDEDGQILDEHEREWIESARRSGWELLTGHSGQDRYTGPIMHPSEFIGGGLAEYILDRPGLYVAIVVELLPKDDDGETEPAGWAIAYRETE